MGLGTLTAGARADERPRGRSARGPYQVARTLHVGRDYEVLLGLMRGPYGFERQVVLKTPRGERLGQRDVEMTLVREATAYSRISHPAVVRMYDFFADDCGAPVLVLEHVDGLSLAGLTRALAARGERIDPRAALYVATRVFAALAAAHSARDPVTREFAPVVHRAVSMDHVLLPWDAFPKLVDFSSALVAGDGADVPAITPRATAPIAPEQRVGEATTVRTDVYLASLLARDLVWGGASPGLMRALERGLRVDPDARDLSAAEMLGILREELGLRGAGRLALLDHLSRVREALPPPDEEGDDVSTPLYPSGVVRRQMAITTPPPGEIVPLMIPRPAPLPAGLSAAPAPTLASSAPAPPRAARSVRPAWPTPHAMIRSAPPPAPPVRGPRSAGRVAALLGVVAALSAGAIVGGGFAFRASSSATQRDAWRRRVVSSAEPPGAPPVAPPITAASSAPPAVATSSAPPITAAVATSSAPTTGRPSPGTGRGWLVTGPEAAGHRVFVDGRWAGAGGGAIAVTCGAREVRVGSAGVARRVVVPCGGEISP